MRLAILPLLVLSAVAHAQPATRPAAATEFASFGVDFRPPGAPWKRILEGGTGHIARWARFGPDNTPDAVMTLEVEPLKGRSLEQYAAAAAKRAGATTAPAEGVTFGGARAMRLSGGKVNNSPSEALLAEHDGRVYVLGAFADPPAELPRDDMAALARDLKFVPPAEPSAYVALRGEKYPLFDRLRIEPLATMRPNPAPPPKGQIGVSTFNFATGKPDLIMTVQFVSNESGATMDALQQQFPGKLNPNQKATWAKLGDSPHATLSSTFDATAGEERMKCRVGLVLLPPTNDVVLIIFNYPNPDPRALSAYEKASEAVVKSVEPLERK